MPSRRAYLAIAASVGLVGCVRGPEADRSTPQRTPTGTRAGARRTETGTGGRTPTPWGEAGTVVGTTVTPRNAWVQQSVLYLSSGDQMGVQDYGDRQMLFATVSVTSGDRLPAASDFSVETDGRSVEEWTTRESVQGYSFKTDGGRLPYSAEESRGWLAFPFADSPSLGERVSLTLAFDGESGGRTRWRLPDTTRDALAARPPAFTLERVEAPDAVGHDEAFDVTLTVSNDGGPGTFRAAVNETGPMYRPHIVRLPIEPGAVESTSVSISSHVRYETDYVRFRVESTDRSAERTLAVERR